MTGLGEIDRCLGHADWCVPAAKRLWRYNQHHFDDLNADGLAARASVEAVGCLDNGDTQSSVAMP